MVCSIKDAIDEHKKFKLMLSDEKANELIEELFGDDGFINTINEELNRRIAIATRFGTPEEKKKRESILRHRLSPDFPFNMLKGIRARNRFTILTGEYKKYLENSLEYVDIQQKLWDALQDNMR